MTDALRDSSRKLVYHGIKLPPHRVGIIADIGRVKAPTHLVHLDHLP
jgi:hypothetical protein